jgi:hypothetical protein
VKETHHGSGLFHTVEGAQRVVVYRNGSIAVRVAEAVCETRVGDVSTDWGEGLFGRRSNRIPVVRATRVTFLGTCGIITRPFGSACMVSKRYACAEHGEDPNHAYKQQQFPW